MPGVVSGAISVDSFIINRPKFNNYFMKIVGVDVS